MKKNGKQISKDKTKVTIVLTFCMLSFLWFLNSCENSTEQMGYVNGSRDYTWSADTLTGGGSYIWGSSQNNVLIVGGSLFWHYNGEKWQQFEANVWGEYCLFGFDENDIWIGGSQGRIWHYDGTSWSENYEYSKGSSSYITVTDIWGTDRKNLMAVGIDYSPGKERGFILKYDGSKWQEVYYADYNSYFQKIKSQHKSKSTYYISGYNRNISTGEDTTILLKYNNGKIFEIYSNPNMGSSYLSLVDDEIYFGVEDNFYNIISDTLDKFLTIENINSYSSVIGGRNKNDLFLAMRDGFMHYNGITIEYLFHLEDNIHPFGNAVVSENTVFLMTETYINNMRTNIIYKGVLKNQ